MDPIEESFISLVVTACLSHKILDMLMLEIWEHVLAKQCHICSVLLVFFR